MQIAIIFGNDGSDVRLGKTCRSLVRLGHEVHFIGWDRRPHEEKNPELPGVTRHVVSFATRHARTNWRAQTIFTRHVVRTLNRVRPEIVCAVNEDNAVRLLPFQRILFRRLICDIYDSHRDRGSNRAWPIRTALSTVSEIARIGSDSVIVTDIERFRRMGRHQSKCHVIGNYPEDPGPELARTRLIGPTKIAVCGTLSESRGLGQLLAAVERTENTTIVAAGWPYDKFAEHEFVSHPRVEFLGIVNSRRALELAAGCDAIFAFYVPNCQNNILASPNKIYDAMSVGRPVIINQEALVSRWVVDESLGFGCPYADVERLRQIIESLHVRRQQLEDAAARYRQRFTAEFNWERMERRLAAIYSPVDEYSLVDAHMLQPA